MLMVGLNCADDLTESSLFGSPDINGFVLGDLFCQKRMFRFGDEGFAALAMAIARQKKAMLYQTPLYATDDVVTASVGRIEWLLSLGVLDGVLVQDVGVVIELRNRFPELNIIWSRMGRTRGNLITVDTFRYLRKIGVAGIENARPNRREVLLGLGFDVYDVLGDMEYRTLSRKCYSCYLNEISIADCNRRCLGDSDYLTTNGIQMTVDGYMIGAKLVYPSEMQQMSCNRKDGKTNAYFASARRAEQVLASVCQFS